MGLSFNYPFELGDSNSAIKSDIAQLKQDVGDLSQLETADKSSLVNALNEAIDSTLNGVNRDLSNLSTVGTQKLRSLNSYANYGELLADADGLSFVQKYAHSTFDVSKFTVVGNPTITNDGIASGFSSSNYLTGYGFSQKVLTNFEIDGEFTTGTLSGGDFVFSNGNTNYKGITLMVTTGNLFLLVANSDGTDWVYNSYILGIVPKDNTKYQYKIIYNNSVLTLSLAINEEEYTEYLVGTFGSGIYFDGDIYIGIRGVNTSQIFASGSIDLKQFSITVDGVEVFSGNKTGIDTIKPDDYTVVGTPTISDDGIASGFSGSNYLQCGIYDWSKPFEIDLSLDMEFSTRQNQIILSFDDIDADGLLNALRISYNSGYTAYEVNWDIEGSYGLVRISNLTAQHLFLKLKYDGSKYSISYKENLSDNWTIVSTTSALVIPHTESLVIGYGIYRAWEGSIDLNAFKIYIDDDLVYQPCLKIPYTESNTGSKIVDAIYRDRVTDMAEQFGYAPYYTLDEDNGNFTLPQVELYGLIQRQNFAPSNKYDELTLGASGNTYTAPADGWFTIKKAASGAQQYIALENNVTKLTTGSRLEVIGNYARLSLPVSKNDIITITYSAGGATDYFNFIYAKGSESEAK